MSPTRRDRFNRDMSASRRLACESINKLLLDKPRSFSLDGLSTRVNNDWRDMGGKPAPFSQRNVRCSSRSCQTARLNTSRTNNKNAISLYDRVSILIRYCYETSLNHWLTRNERTPKFATSNGWKDTEHFIFIFIYLYLYLYLDLYLYLYLYIYIYICIYIYI